MMKDFEKIAALGTLLSKKYAVSLFRLLRDYKSISASEASSRLDLHIQTVQEFLETSTLLGITLKEEVFERKRPYFRYTIQSPSLTYKFDLDELVGYDKHSKNEIRIREKKNLKSHFTTARNGNFFSSVSVISGSGRGSEQRKINLTQSQGLFLFHLPFPDAQPDSVESIMAKAKIDTEYKSEIDNLVDELIDLGIIEQIEY